MIDTEPQPGGPARPVRAFPAPLPDGPVVIAAPPATPEPDGSKWATTVLPALSSFGIVGFALVSGSLLYVLLGVLLSVVGVGAALGARLSTSRARRRRQTAARQRYAAHLDERHATLGDLASQQQRALRETHPDPASWRLRVAGDRLWERRPRDPDFLTVRLGRGRVPLAVPIRLEPAPPAVEEEPDLRAEAEMLVALHTALDDVAATVDLSARRTLVLQGMTEHRRPLLRAVIAGLALTHAPGELQLLAATAEQDASWLTRLPHTVGRADSLRELRSLLVRARGPATVAAVDLEHVQGEQMDGAVVDALLTDAGPQARLVVAIPPEGSVPATADVHVLVGAEGLQVRFADGTPPRTVARPDALNRHEAAQLADALAEQPVRPSSGPREWPVRLTPLLEQLSDRTGLRVPLGRDTLGEPVVLDLDEAARGGDGPHGLLVGATGSGKSELLRSVLGTLVSRCSPAELAVVTWDFKGGAAMGPFVGLPHLRAALTNLDSDPRLMARAARALRAELRRRQTVLAETGVDAVAQLPVGGPGASASHVLPRLLLVVDEFSELLAAHPDLLDLFVTVARLGRSLGIHLLLSSQRLEEGRLRGLDSQLRYRICLRTFSAADSQTMLGTDAAFRLPSTPGSGLLSVDSRVVRFDGALADDLPHLVGRAHERWRSVPLPGPALWQPDLPVSLPLPAAVPGDGTGLRLTVPVGMVDLPDQQLQVPFVLDLAQGHVAVVGAPGSGRTTALATLVVSLAAGSRAEHLEVHVVSDDRRAFAVLRDLPHVRSVLEPTDEETLQHLLGGLVSRVRRGPKTATDGPGERSVLLLVDDWNRLRRAAEECGDLVAELAAAGPHRGVHLVVTGTSWSEFRTGLREHLGTHCELRLADPYESEHGRHRAASVPKRPGRLISPAGDDAQLALPRIDGVGPEELGAAQRCFVATVIARGDAVLPPLRALPERVSLPPPVSRAAGGSAGTGVVLGVDAEGTLEQLDLQGPGRHLLVVGESGSGRTTALRTVLAQLPAPETDVWVVDPRRTLLSAVEDEARYAYSPTGTAEMLAELARRLEVLRPPEGLSRRELLTQPRRPIGRNVVVIDDYDLLPGTGLTGPLGSLTELLPLADEVGLTLVVARGIGARLGYDPGWQALQDSAATGLLLSGDPSAGPVLSGLRAVRRRPGRGLVLRRDRPPTVVQVALPDTGDRAREPEATDGEPWRLRRRLQSA